MEIALSHRDSRPVPDQWEDCKTRHNTSDACVRLGSISAELKECGNCLSGVQQMCNHIPDELQETISRMIRSELRRLYLAGSDDLFQETWCELIARWHKIVETFDPRKGPFTGWLRCVVRNTLVDNCARPGGRPRAVLVCTERALGSTRMQAQRRNAHGENSKCSCRRS